MGFLLPIPLVPAPCQPWTRLSETLEGLSLPCHLLLTGTLAYLPPAHLHLSQHSRLCKHISPTDCPCPLHQQRNAQSLRSMVHGRLHRESTTVDLDPAPRPCREACSDASHLTTETTLKQLHPAKVKHLQAAACQAHHKSCSPHIATSLKIQSSPKETWTLRPPGGYPDVES